MSKATRKTRPSTDGAHPRAQDVKKLTADELPRRTIEEAIRIVEVLHHNYSGNPASWEEIAKLLGVAASNMNNKYPLWAAVAYGLIAKNEDGLFSITETGRKIVAPNDPGEDKEGRVKALLTPKILSKFFTDYNGHSLPDATHFPNVLENRYAIPRDRTSEAISLIVANGRYAGVLKEEPGGRTTVRLDSTSLPTDGAIVSGEANAEKVSISDGAAAATYDWQATCFFITPIGEEGSEQRRHADMVQKHIIEPVAKEYGLQVVRADRIERSGLITQQIFEQLARSRLCVADLSFTNANDFYELGVRHTCKLPTIQLIRKSDKIPFDVAQGRTITIDTTDIYLIADRLESARKELGEHVRHIMNAEHEEPGDDNPVHLYLPKLKVSVLG